VFVATLLAACLGLAAPAAASAETFFVDQSGSGSECAEAAPCATIDQALTTSRNTAGTGDRIEVGPGLYEERVVIDKPEDSGLTLHGAGRGPDQESTPAGATTFRSPETKTGAEVAITAAAVTIESIRVEVPAGFENTEGIALGGSADSARLVQVEDLGATNTDAILVTPSTPDATIQNARVRHLGEYRGVAIFGPRATILDSDIFTAEGQALDTEFMAEGTRIVRTRIATSGGFIATIRSGDVLIDTSLLLGGSIGVEAFANFGAITEVKLTNDTIDLGKPKVVDKNGVAARARAETGGTARVTLINSIAVEKQEVEGSATESVGCRSSIVPLQAESGPKGNIECDAGEGNVSVPASSVFAPGADWHLVPGSPAVDSGAAGEALSTTDLDGNPRVVDGNRDGVAVIDRGAYELPTPPPPSTAPSVTPPSNALSLGSLKRNTKRGTAKLQVRIAGPGSLSLSGKRVKRATIAAARGGTFSLSIARKPKLAGILRSKGSAKTSIRVTFTPTGGTANTVARTLRLIRRPSRPARRR
jgi:hypothetical protein